MATYIVVRHGSNAANQHLLRRLVLGTLTSEDRLNGRQAIQSGRQAAAVNEWLSQRGETAYHNQYVELMPWSRARASDQDAARAADMSDSAYAADRAAERAEVLAEVRAF